MYIKFKKWLENGGAIPDDKQLKEELLAVDYFYTTNGKMQLIEKKLIKQVLGRSPDKADSCAFNFFEQIRRIERTESFIAPMASAWN